MSSDRTRLSKAECIWYAIGGITLPFVLTFANDFWMWMDPKHTEIDFWVAAAIYMVCFGMCIPLIARSMEKGNVWTVCGIACLTLVAVVIHLFVLFVFNFLVGASSFGFDTTI